MRKRLGILGMAALLLAGCYDDKGNYDYHAINDVLGLTFLPAPQSVTLDSVFTYSYPMATVDTMYMAYTAEFTQSQATDESQLEFQWILPSEKDDKVTYDTVFSKTLTLGFPFQELITYEPLFRLIDHSTGIEYYRKFKMSTREAYINSWYVLHGEEGDRRLGVAEADSTAIVVTADAYETAMESRRFQNAEGLFYTCWDLMLASRDIDDNEKLYVYQPDSCTQLQPFTFEQRKDYGEMFQPGLAPKRIVGAVDDEVGDCGTMSASMLICEDGSLYWTRSGANGYWFTVKSDVDFHADQVFIPRGCAGNVNNTRALIWDDTRKQFFYYVLPNSSLARDGFDAHPGDSYFDQTGSRVQPVPEDAFEEGELDNMDVLAMVLGTEDGFTGVVFHDNADDSYWYYVMGFDGREGSSLEFQVERTQLVDLGINEDSRFATSAAYADQLFFTVGGELYLYTIISDNVASIYSAGAGSVITDIRFAMSRTYSGFYFPNELNSRLGVAVETAAGEGELHDLRLENSGDVGRSFVCQGFGPIVDMVFSARNSQF